MSFPLKATVHKDDGEWTEDRFGNRYWESGDLIPVKVFAWEITRTEEQDEYYIMRTIDDLIMIAKPNTFEPQNRIVINDGESWEVQGNPLDSNNNPYYSPGLVIYRARKVEG